MVYDGNLNASMTSSFVTAKPKDDVGSVWRDLRSERRDVVDVIIVQDDGGAYIGLVEIRELLAASCETRVQDIMRQDATAISVDADIETAASLAIQSELSSLPVVDDRQKPIGVLSSGTLMNVLRTEHIEDIHHMAGVWQKTSQARVAMVGNPFARARYRLPWLMVGFVGSMLATVVVASFEETLQSQIAVAFFLPAIVYLADAVGTQSEAIAVRGLSFLDIDIRNLVFGELVTGTLMGLVLAFLTGAFAFCAFGDQNLSIAIFVSVVCACSVAAAIGILLPWVFAKIGWDPAMASGPIATVIQDVISLAIYLGAVSVASTF